MNNSQVILQILLVAKGPLADRAQDIEDPVFVDTGVEVDLEVAVGLKSLPAKGNRAREGKQMGVRAKMRKKALKTFRLVWAIHVMARSQSEREVSKECPVNGGIKGNVRRISALDHGQGGKRQGLGIKGNLTGKGGHETPLPEIRFVLAQVAELSPFDPQRGKFPEIEGGGSTAHDLGRAKQCKENRSVPILFPREDLKNR